MKKILILYNSIGWGHKSIAENIGFYLEREGFEVRLADILELEQSKLVRIGTWLYGILFNYAPWVWHGLYTSKWFTNLTLRYRTGLAAKYSSQVQKLLDEFRPDLVISTHTNSSAVMSFLKQQGKFKGKFGIAFSDFHLHRYWLYWQADFYLVNINEQKEEMLELGIPIEKIFVCGMTLKPKPAINEQNVRSKLGIMPGQKVALMASGSLGWGIDKQLVSDFNKISNLRTLVVCGRNHELYESLKKTFADSPVIILEYYSPLEELYAIADIFLTKPGGLSISEALRWRLPILITHLMPGQEELNYNYLTDKGLVMPEPINLVDEAKEELQTGAFRQNLKENPNLAEIFKDPEVLIAGVKSVLYGESDEHR